MHDYDQVGEYEEQADDTGLLRGMAAMALIACWMLACRVIGAVKRWHS